MVNRSQRTSTLPGSQGKRPDGLRVDHRMEVAVPGVPAGEREPGQRGHVDVRGQQVVADLDPVMQDVVEEDRRR